MTSTAPTPPPRGGVHSGSCLREPDERRCPECFQRQADRDLDLLKNLSVDYVADLTHAERRRIHNLKYYTWIEQLGKDLAELRAQWDDYRAYWGGLHGQQAALDAMIAEFNAEVAK